LLKRKTKNPNATIVAQFLNAVHEVYSPLDYQGSMRSDMKRMRPYILMTRDIVKNSNRSNTDFIEFTSAQVLFRDFEESFNHYKRECCLNEISKAAGLKMNSKSTIVHPWPMRIRKNATQREFNVLRASGHSGAERYVERESAA